MLRACNCALELAPVQTSVKPFVLEKLPVGALLDDLPSVDDYDPTGVTNRAEPMGMTKLVRPFMSRSIASWMWASVLVSTLPVASSRIRMDGRARAARAMARSCLCPWLRLVPSSVSKV